MRKTFKYRISANKETTAKAEYWLELCRVLYNSALAERIYAYKMQGMTISCFSQMKQLPDIKQENPEYRLVGSQTLQEVLERLDKAYKAFFRRVKQGGAPGFPRFKGKSRYDSFTLKQAGWKLEGKYLYVRNIGKFKLKLSRQIEGDVKTITIGRSPTNKWYACFSCDNVPERRLPQSDRTIGLDVGIKSFLTDSEGTKVENPKFLKHTLKELRVRQRKLAKANKGSSRRKKTKLRVAKCHEKIANQRRDFHHKLADKYVKGYGVIVIENLGIANMVQNHKLARDISDCAWGEFLGILSYRAEEAGRKVIKAPRFEPTSKKCSCCGEVNHNLKLSDRTWVCLQCGTIHDRDENAAINLKRFGQNHQEVTYASTQCVS